MPKRLTTNVFIERAKEKHGNKYDYSITKYTTLRTKVVIVCPVHGKFIQWPGDHMRGHQCAQCGNELGSVKESLTTKEFIIRAKKIHNNKYDYSLTTCRQARKKLTISCPIHGEFIQKAYSHLNGNGCKQCANANTSKLENDWLTTIDATLERHSRIYVNENKYYKPDGYDATTNTIYEFFGDYWHGNPARFNANKINHTNKKLFGELYNETMNKIVEYEQQGYNVVYIWETDFLAMENK